MKRRPFDALTRNLLQLDPRVLSLVLFALPVMLALLGWGQILRPAWQARQTALTQQARIEAAIAELPRRRAEAGTLARQADELEARLDAPDSAPRRLPTLLDSLAAHHGIELQPIFPGRNIEFDGLVETRYAIEATGSYPALVAWLAGLDATLPNAGVIQARFTRNASSGKVGLGLQLAVYRSPAAPPVVPEGTR